MIDKLPYRKCAGIMLLNKSGNVFVAQRINSEFEAWQMPQGGIDDGEEPAQGAMRELLEEIGTNNANIIAQSQNWLRYDLPEELIGKVWKGKFRGQEQKWFLMEFLGDDNDINIETEHPEFNQWKWVNPQELPDLIVPFKKQLYKDVLGEFLPYIKRQINE